MSKNHDAGRRIQTKLPPPNFREGGVPSLKLGGGNFLGNSGAYPPNDTVSRSRTKYDLNLLALELFFLILPHLYIKRE